MLHLILDGYNVLSQGHFNTRDDFIKKLKRYIKSSGHQMTIYFDGTHQGTFHGDLSIEEGVKIIYTPITVTADDMIEEYLKKNRSPRITVISSDRRIQKAATAANVSFISSEDFLKKMESNSNARSTTQNLPWMEGRSESSYGPKPKKGNARRSSKKNLLQHRTLKKI